MTDSPDRYLITEYNPKFREDIIALEAYLWGANKELNRRYWQWKSIRSA